MTTGAQSMLPGDLIRWINDCGFFPQLVADAVTLSLADEDVDEFVVQHEAVVGPDDILRHLTVLVLTPSRLLVVHTDEQADEHGQPVAVTSSESVPLDTIGVVTLTRSISNPEQFGTARRSHTIDIVLSLGWGAVRSLEVVPAQCSDPQCGIQGCFSGEMVNEDLTVRMSPAADDDASVAHLMGLATLLQRRVPARRQGR
ncbi:DUF5998 family protein [Propionibacterium sp.]|uniref:DUF5998 family protein n=1 Tax=Propionibacterium sp. TaxID=1977903 RepID=UPI0039EAD71F